MAICCLIGDGGTGEGGSLPDTGGSGKCEGGVGKEARDAREVSERFHLSPSIEGNGLERVSEFDCSVCGAR